MAVIEISDGQLHSELKKAGEKLVIIDFTAVWCGPCRMISPVFDQLASDPNYQQKAVFLKCDVDKCRATAQQCSISAMPTFQFYLNSKKVAEFSGADPNKLKSLLEKHLPANVSFNTPGHALGSGGSGASRLLDLQNSIPTTKEAMKPNPQMLSELKEMGFPENRAIKALLIVKNESTNSAMEWIFSNMDNPDIDEPYSASDNNNNNNSQSTAPTTSSSSTTTSTSSGPNDAPTVHNARCDICTQQIIGIRYKCKKCPDYDLCQVCKDSGKHPSDHEFAEHATDIMNPQLTDEERKLMRDRLEARIQEVRKSKAEDEAKREIDREITRRSSGKMQQESVTKWQEQQIKREADKAKKEKEDEIRAKQKIRDKIAQDKLERAAKKTGTPVAAPAPAAPAPVPTPAAPAAIPDQVLIQIRLQSGEVVRATFKPTDTLSAVHAHLSANGHAGSFKLSTTYPRKIYDSAEMKATTLLDAGLVPNGTLMVTK